MPSAEKRPDPARGPTSSGRPEVVEEARRVMTVCNACRYCEGLCAVFPAMARRTSFREGDLRYLASLCHDCRGCFYACQYAPPHEFDINVPKVFSELRRDTYERHTTPRWLGAAYRRNGLVVGLAAGVAAVIVPLLGILLRDPSTLRTARSGEGAFYEVVPMAAMVVPASVIALLALTALVVSGVRYWREIAPSESVRGESLAAAAADALRLTYLGGGGDGCNYPDEDFSTRRRFLHHFVFWGFTLDFASTSVAALYEHVFHRSAPYPLWSIPVLLGTIGGLLLLAGTTGLLWAKRASDRQPADSGSVGMDVAFLALLWGTSLSGLLLLALRETALMPALLLLHLGFVAGFFVTLPFGKFVHAVHRYLALVRHRIEEASD